MNKYSYKNEFNLISKRKEENVLCKRSNIERNLIFFTKFGRFTLIATKTKFPPIYFFLACCFPIGVV